MEKTLKRFLIGYVVLFVCAMFVCRYEGPPPSVRAQGYTETFFVCEGGDGTLPETATCATAWDAADFSTSGNWNTGVDADDGKIGANDRVEIMDDGGTHRGQFYFKGSGSAGKPITVINQTGDSPVISGAELVTGWTLLFSTAWSATLGTDKSGDNDENARNLLSAGNISTDGSTVRIVISPSTSTSGQVDGASICVRDGTTDDCTGTPTRITFNSGSNSVALTGGGADVTSDDISFTLDSSKDHFVHLFMDDLHYRIRGTNSGSDGIYTSYGSGVDDTTTQTIDYGAISAGATIGLKELQAASNIYYATLATECYRVFHGSTELTENDGNYATLGSNEWDWDANKLYVNIGQNPTGETIEATQIGPNPPVYIRDKDYITIDGLEITKSNGSGVCQEAGTSSYVTIQNCTISYNAGNGIIFIDANGGTYWTISNNTFLDNGLDVGLDHGIYLENGDNCTIEGNTFTGSAGYAVQLQDGCDNNTVRYNFSSDNGSGFVVLSNDGGGGSTGNSISYNVSTGDPRCLFLYEPGNTGNEFYANTCYGYTTYCIDIETDVGLTAKNNICWSEEPGVKAINTDPGLEFSASDFNIFGPESANYITYNSNNYSTLAAYVAAQSQDAHSLKDDPLFTAPGSSDFTLQATSPALDAGTDLGSSYDDALNPASSWPSSVSTLDQDDWGTGWEIGAYIRKYTVQIIVIGDRE